MSEPKKPACDCLGLVNTELAKRGYELQTGNVMRLDENGAAVRYLGRPVLLKVQRSGPKTKGGSPRVWGRYCPFCGTEQWRPEP